MGRPHPATGVPQDLIEQEPGSGPLGKVSQDLDEEFYWVSAENRRVRLRWSLQLLFAAFRQIGLMAYGEATPTRQEDEETLQRPAPVYRDTTTWIRYLSQVEDPVSLVAPAGPDPERPTSPYAWEVAVCWRLDIMLGLSELPPSRQRVLRRYADGYGWDSRTGRKNLDEISEMGESPIASQSVRDMLRETSRHVRRHAELNVPAFGSPPRQPREQEPKLHAGGGIQRVEQEWAKVRGGGVAR